MTQHARGSRWNAIVATTALAVVGWPIALSTPAHAAAPACDPNAVTTYTATDTPQSIPDRQTVSSVITVPDTVTISDVNAAVDITHTFDGDLLITLTHGATTVTLSDRHGGPDDNFTGTVFDDEATTPIGSGAAPFTGSYRPEQPLSGFDGADTAGDWTLTVKDMAWSDQGTLNSWSLDIASCTQTTTSVSAAPVVFGQDGSATATVDPAAAGVVQFAVDGADVGAPVTVTNGSATSPALTGLAVGSHEVTATFTPDNPDDFIGSVGSSTLVVDQAETTTSVVVDPTVITATVAPVPPGAGVPSGTVRFLLGRRQIGTADLDGSGVAFLDYVVPTDTDQKVAAVYDGDPNFLASSGSTARNNPVITATVSSSVPATVWGWYREPVTVSFTCTPNGSPLVGACPAPVTVTATGAAQEVSGTITAEDGGVATASVSVNLDRVVPRAIVTGVTSGQTYVTPPAIRTKARDLESGVAWSRFKTHSLGKTTWYRLKVRDRAGNESLVKGWYKVNPAG